MNKLIWINATYIIGKNGQILLWDLIKIFISRKLSTVANYAWFVSSRRWRVVDSGFLDSSFFVALSLFLYLHVVCISLSYLRIKYLCVMLVKADWIFPLRSSSTEFFLVFLLIMAHMSLVVQSLDSMASTNSLCQQFRNWIPSGGTWSLVYLNIFTFLKYPQQIIDK